MTTLKKLLQEQEESWKKDGTPYRKALSEAMTYFVEKISNRDKNVPAQEVVEKRNHVDKEVEAIVKYTQQELIECIANEIEKTNVSDDKVGTFKEGHDCLKTQIKTLLQEALKD